MRKRTLIPLVALLAFAVPSLVRAEAYGWTISGSSSSPNENSGIATSGISTLYLWYDCSQNDGMAAAEFDIDTRGMSLLATTPKNFFLNAGGASELLLAVGACPRGPVVAAELLVLDTPGSICFSPSRLGQQVVVDCTINPAPEFFPFAWVGYSNDGSEPCSRGTRCHSVHMREASFGEIKQGYSRTP